MTLIECTNTKEIPSVTLAGFSLSDKYTVDHAAIDFKRHYGVEPKTAYKWGDFLYIELPEGK